ncbi:MAG TPA: sigma-70 factor domain-containing protein, partial [Angustibacter sp.]|nr:sigma-70 factor domain-containing protein [Angustibacter sp.]
MPAEFTHPALQDLLRRGRTNGVVDAGSVRHALEQADLPLRRMKAVLRALDEQGISVQVEEAPARAVAATATKRATATAKAAGKTASKTATKKTAAKKAQAEQTSDETAEAPATKAAAKKSTAKKATAKKTAAKASTKAAATDESDELEGDEAVDAVDAPEGEAVEETVEETGFVITDDDDDAPAQQVATAGATADPVKDYLKQIGKVALLNAEQEVELAKRIEAGLFAEERLNSGAKIDPKLKRELWWIAQDGKKAKNHLLEANLR